MTHIEAFPSILRLLNHQKARASCKLLITPRFREPYRTGAQCGLTCNCVPWDGRGVFGAGAASQDEARARQAGWAVSVCALQSAMASRSTLARPPAAPTAAHGRMYSVALALALAGPPLKHSLHCLDACAPVCSSSTSSSRWTPRGWRAFRESRTTASSTTKRSVTRKWESVTGVALKWESATGVALKWESVRQRKGPLTSLPALSAHACLHGQRSALSAACATDWVRRAADRGSRAVLTRPGDGCSCG